MTDIYNNVGKHILAECKANRVTYKYACVNKIRQLPYFQQWLRADREERLKIQRAFAEYEV